MERQEFFKEIKRMAVDNEGQAPGWRAFASTTASRKSEWYPHLWLRWGDALAEAAYAPNEFQTKISDDVLIEKYIGLVRELGRLPVEGEVRRKAKADQSFPNHSTFSRFGGKNKLREAVAAYCRKIPGFEDILPLCAHDEITFATSVGERKREPKVATEFVYLMKSGKHYKIGRTNSVGRHGTELGH